MHAPLHRMTLNRFAVLGRVGMDLMADPPGTRIEEARAFTTAIGGSAGNIAVALARQDAQAALISCISDDAVGRFCAADLARYGVDTSHLRPVAGEARNSLALTETRAEGCQTVLYRNGAADFALTPDQIEQIDFTPFAALILTGTALARDPSRSATFAAIARARAAGALTVLDVDYRAYSWSSRQEAAATCLMAAQACDITIGNDDEFALMAGSYDEGPTLARHLATQGALFTVYKRGAEGCTTHRPEGSFDTPIFAVTALKPTGAGDGFMGGLLAALAQGAPLDTAIQRGAATAAIIVSGLGCAPASPDRATLDAFLRQHQG
ncbi:MAG: 5-dehydro-2-deoxygluconokinase [Rhodobacteraceae bacterium]|nr:5-dehydro-2-deoxygluconokinase [Paracoccaceae bacterium]